MNPQKAHINGFLKRAAEHGLSQEQAHQIYKQANPGWMSDPRVTAGTSGMAASGNMPSRQKAVNPVKKRLNSLPRVNAEADQNDIASYIKTPGSAAPRSYLDVAGHMAAPQLNSGSLQTIPRQVPPVVGLPYGSNPAAGGDIKAMRNEAIRQRGAKSPFQDPRTGKLLTPAELDDLR